MAVLFFDDDRQLSSSINCHNIYHINEQTHERNSNSNSLFYYDEYFKSNEYMYCIPDTQYIYKKGYLSLKYCSYFRDEHGLIFNNVYQYIIYKKAIFFNNFSISTKILNVTVYNQLVKLNDCIEIYYPILIDKWNQIYLDVIYDGCYLNFSQNPYLKEYLLSTGDNILAYAINNTELGIGFKEEDAWKLEQSEWSGRNLLGKSLMNVREQLKRYF
jgi:ribA/ribD-fused uncharacterized protein